MLFRVLIEGDGYWGIETLTYSELLRRIDQLLHECVVYGLSGFSISILEEVDHEGQGSENTQVGPN